MNRIITELNKLKSDIKMLDDSYQKLSYWYRDSINRTNLQNLKSTIIFL